jgi:putative aminopeptidase FrvX
MTEAQMSAAQKTGKGIKMINTTKRFTQYHIKLYLEITDICSFTNISYTSAVFSISKTDREKARIQAEQKVKVVVVGKMKNKKAAPVNLDDVWDPSASDQTQCCLECDCGVLQRDGSQGERGGGSSW